MHKITMIQKQKFISSLICLTIFLLFVSINVKGNPQKTIEVQSPDKTIKVILTVGEQISYSVLVDEKMVIESSPISMTIDENRVLGLKPGISDYHINTVSKVIKPVIPEKYSTINDYYNELVMDFIGNYSVIFRAYNNGVAYRFKTRMNGELKVYSEQVTFNFTENNSIYFPEEEGFFSHNERSYKYIQLDNLSAGRLASLPSRLASAWETAGVHRTRSEREHRTARSR